MTTKHAPGRARVEGGPVTLQQAHDVLRRLRPRGTTSARKWQAYYLEAARVYSTVADVDTDHHYEALTFAAAAQEDAEKFNAATVPNPRK